MLRYEINFSCSTTTTFRKTNRDLNTLVLQIPIPNNFPKRLVNKLLAYFPVCLNRLPLNSTLSSQSFLPLTPVQKDCLELLPILESAILFATCERVAVVNFRDERVLNLFLNWFNADKPFPLYSARQEAPSLCTERINQRTFSMRREHNHSSCRIGCKEVIL